MKLQPRRDAQTFVIQHLKLELAKVGLETERYRFRREGLRLARAVVVLLMIGAILWVTYALRIDLLTPVVEHLMEVLM